MEDQNKNKIPTIIQVIAPYLSLQILQNIAQVNRALYKETPYWIARHLKHRNITALIIYNDGGRLVLPLIARQGKRLVFVAEIQDYRDKINNEQKQLEEERRNNGDESIAKASPLIQWLVDQDVTELAIGTQKIRASAIEIVYICFDKHYEIIPYQTVFTHEMNYDNAYTDKIYSHILDHDVLRSIPEDAMFVDKSIVKEGLSVAYRISAPSMSDLGVNAVQITEVTVSLPHLMTWPNSPDKVFEDNFNDATAIISSARLREILMSAIVTLFVLNFLLPYIL